MLNINVGTSKSGKSYSCLKERVKQEDGTWSSDLIMFLPQTRIWDDGGASVGLGNLDEIELLAKTLMGYVKAHKGEKAEAPTNKYL